LQAWFYWALSLIVRWVNDETNVIKAIHEDVKAGIDKKNHENIESNA